jgi:hypothetical protein
MMRQALPEGSRRGAMMRAAAVGGVFLLVVGLAWLILHLSGMGILIRERWEAQNKYKVCVYVHSTGLYDRIISLPGLGEQPADLEALMRPCPKTIRLWR